MWSYYLGVRDINCVIQEIRMAMVELGVLINAELREKFVYMRMKRMSTCARVEKSTVGAQCVNI